MPARATPNRVDSKETSEKCLDAYSDGQRARKRGQFTRAHELLAFCGGASCPAALHGDCQRWLSEVEAATPTGVFRVTDAQGVELTDVTLSIDGGPAQPLTGRAVSFEPGEHQLVFEANGFFPEQRHFSFVEGEKLVTREVQLQRQGSSSHAAEWSRSVGLNEDPLPQSRSTGTNLPVWLGIGAGALGAAGFAYFGLAARREEKALGLCSPNCAASKVNEVEQKYLVANVSLGVGVVGLVGAAAWLVFKPSSSASSGTGVSNFELHLGANSATLQGRF